MDTKVIEIIGPPGIGKTTLYDYLCSNYNSEANWTYQEALLIPAPGMEDLKGWIAYQCKRSLGIKLHKHISSDFGMRFINSHYDLCSFLWDHISKLSVYSKEELDMRYRSVNNLFLDFCRYQAISETGTSKPCLICEGLLQKSFLTQLKEEEMPAFVEQYIHHLPLPSGVIYINTQNSEVIVERLLKRKKVIAAHLGKDKKMLLADIKKWCFLFDCITNSLQVHKVPVYFIDGMKSIKENADFLQKVLNNQQVPN